MYSAVWSEGEMLILIAIVTKLLLQSLWLFIFLATWHQCNFNWRTHHECFFSTSSLGTWTVKSATGVVKCEAFRLVWTVLSTQGWVRPAIFSPHQLPLLFVFCCFGVFVLFCFHKLCSQRQLMFFFRSPVSFWVCLHPCCQSPGMKLLSAYGGLTAALGCTDIWKYFCRFRNSQFGLFHLTWSSVIANNSMPGTRARVKGIFHFSQENYEAWKNHCLISLPLPF